VVLFVGQGRGKGYPALLRTWSTVLKGAPDAVLAWRVQAEASFAGSLRVSRNTVSEISGLPNELGKADAFAGCDVFCLPSAHESFGIVYVEAWSYGKPVICGTAPACRELVEPGVTGLHSSHGFEAWPPPFWDCYPSLRTRPGWGRRAVSFSGSALPGNGWSKTIWLLGLILERIGLRRR